MDSTIINLGDSNSIQFLSFLWRARFKNDSIINQFDDNGKEHLFKEVKDRFSELSYFYLIHKKLPICFSIDLKNGLIFFNNHQKIESNLLKEKKTNIRLIVFRRHNKKIGTEDLKIINYTITYFFGFQYNDSLGNNRKIILQIDELGNFVILGE